MTTTATAPSARRFSIAHLVLILPWIALVIDAWAPIRDNSFLWHIRAGSMQSEAGAVLTADPFSFTEGGEPWLTQSWLAELVYSTGEGWSNGLGFVAPMMLLLTSVTFVALAMVAYRRSTSISGTAMVLLLATILLISFLVPRPVIFSFALFAVVLLAWDIPKLRWTLPFLFWIWASVHGSFVIGLAYIGLTLIAEKEWRWFLTAVVTALATLATAHGLGVIAMLMDFADARETLSLLSEWQRPGLTDPVFIPFVVALAVITFGFWRRTLSWRHLWIVVPFVVLGMSSLRAVPPAFLGLIPIVATSLRGWRLGMSPRLSTGPALVLTVVVMALPFLVKGDGTLSESRFPIEARSHLTDVNTFHDDRTGGYLIYSDGPAFQVFIDDRAELYGDRMAEFVAVRDGESPWEPVFERDGITQVLLPNESDLLDEIHEAGWTSKYTDENFTILSR